VKDAQVTLQNTITSTKKSKKRRQESQKICVDNGMEHWKLKTLIKTIFSSKIIIIIIYYGGEKIVILSERIHNVHVGYCIGNHIILKPLNPIVLACVMTQF